MKKLVEKAIKTMESRKNNTEKALKDAFWIVEKINFMLPAVTGCRTTGAGFNATGEFYTDDYYNNNSFKNEKCHVQYSSEGEFIIVVDLEWSDKWEEVRSLDSMDLKGFYESLESCLLKLGQKETLSESSEKISGLRKFLKDNN